MASLTPSSITPAEARRRRHHVKRIAASVGFVGAVEYRHVYSQSGGAQYAVGATRDLLIVYAEAFERDADPEDFSLPAIIAHERGHQLLIRDPRLADRMVDVSLAAEEVLASLLGARAVGPGSDRDALIAKATADVLSSGVQPDAAVRLVDSLWTLLGELE